MYDCGAQLQAIELLFECMHVCMCVCVCLQVYHALRCDAMDTAIEAAGAQSLGFPGGYQVASEMQGWLTAWRGNGRQLPLATAAEIERVAVGLVESKELEKQGVPLARAAVLTLCVLSGSVKPLNAAIASDARNSQQALLPGSGVVSIEDWMWLRCSVAHSQHDEGARSALRCVIGTKQLPIRVCKMCRRIRLFNAALASRLPARVRTTAAAFTWPMKPMLRTSDWKAACQSKRGCGAGLGEDAGALRQLQQDVCAADPSHYTRGGTHPVLYVVVLLLSLQFRRALNFLHVHPMCRELRVVAPALSLVVHAHTLTTLGGAGDLCGPAAGHAGLVNRIPATVRAHCHCLARCPQRCALQAASSFSPAPSSFSVVCFRLCWPRDKLLDTCT